jgi:hypothetical protein
MTGQPFARALRLRTRTGQQFPNIYAVQVQATPTGSVKQGDVLLATFYVRGIEGGQAETGETQTQFVFERASDPHTKSAEQDVAIPRGGEWKRIFVPFRAAEDGPQGGTQVSFRLGYPAQVIEIGGLSLVNYGTSVALQDLPRTPATYAGREPNACVAQGCPGAHREDPEGRSGNPGGGPEQPSGSECDGRGSHEAARVPVRLGRGRRRLARNWPGQR